MYKHQYTIVFERDAFMSFDGNIVHLFSCGQLNTRQPQSEDIQCHHHVTGDFGVIFEDEEIEVNRRCINCIEVKTNIRIDSLFVDNNGIVTNPKTDREQVQELEAYYEEIEKSMETA